MLIYSKIPFNRTIDFKSKGFPLSYEKNIEDTEKNIEDA